MSQDVDRVDQAFQAMKARSRGRVMSELNLEERLMQEFSNVQSQRRRGRTMALAVGLMLVLGGVGFAAAGGVEYVRSWFTLVELVDPSGESPSMTYELRGNQLFDVDGTAVGEITLDGDESNGASANHQTEGR